MNLGDLLIALGAAVAGHRVLGAARARTRTPMAGTALRGGADLSLPTGQLQRVLDKLPRGRTPGKATLRDIGSLDARVKAIRGMLVKGSTDPDIRMMTARLLSKKCGANWCTAERDWEQEVRLIYDAVRKHVRYTRDPENADLFQHPFRTLQTGAGDCDCMSAVLGAMLMSVGYTVRLRVIQSIEAKDWNHIYVLVGMPPGDPEGMTWVPLDASVPGVKPGWQPPKEQITRYRDFKVS